MREKNSRGSQEKNHEEGFFAEKNFKRVTEKKFMRRDFFTGKKNYENEFFHGKKKFMRRDFFTGKKNSRGSPEKN